MKIEEILEKYNQKQMLAMYNSLEGSQKEEFASQIKRINFDEMNSLFARAATKEDKTYTEILPIDNVCVKEEISKSVTAKWESIGREKIEKGQFAVVTMAGGQGTRLGHTKPKGTYMLSVQGKMISIFEILISRLKEAYHEYGVYIPWYIMTSEENNSDTVKFFEENNYFGYDASHVMFFKQGELPMQDTYGNIVCDTKAHIKFAANGNGGVFKAICYHVLQDMEKRNVQYVYFSGVDNILANFVDALLLGGMIDSGLNAATKSVLKAYPEEKVGVICKRNGKPAVVEYMELTPQMCNLRKANGELAFSESNIVSNIFSIELLKRAGNLPYHTAVKKSSVVKADGSTVEEDVYKYEMFIFDIYSELKDIFVLRVKREDEFAPIKNKEGVDSPDTAVEMYLKANKQK